MLTVKNLCAGYGGSHVVSGLSITVKRGQTVVIIGPNGAGKTTTLKTLSGLLPVHSGSIELTDTDITHLPAEKRSRMGLIHVPEGRHVFGSLSVEDNLYLGAYQHLPHVLGYRRKAAVDLQAVYELLPRLKERRGKQAGTLSGGEQQMLAIGRAVMSKPHILMLDEPSMGLDPHMVEVIFGLLKALQAKGMTILVVEQLAEKALQIADYAYVIERGSVTAEGTPQEMRQDLRVTAAYLGKTN